MDSTHLARDMTHSRIVLIGPAHSIQLPGFALERLSNGWMDYFPADGLRCANATINWLSMLDAASASAWGWNHLAPIQCSAPWPPFPCRSDFRDGHEPKNSTANNWTSTINSGSRFR